jgi:hypothetical protein
VEEVLQNIYHWANKYVFLQIALFEDYFGQKIKQRLHLTVRPKKWWDGQLQKFEYKVLACSKNDKGEECYAIYLLEKINRFGCFSLAAKHPEMTEKSSQTHRDSKATNEYYSIIDKQV